MQFTSQRMVFVVACTHNCSWDLVIKLLFVSFFAISNKEPAIPYEQLWTADTHFTPWELSAVLSRGKVFFFFFSSSKRIGLRLRGCWYARKWYLETCFIIFLLFIISCWLKMSVFLGKEKNDIILANKPAAPGFRRLYSNAFPVHWLFFTNCFSTVWNLLHFHAWSHVLDSGYVFVFQFMRGNL